MGSGGMTPLEQPWLPSVSPVLAKGDAPETVLIAIGDAMRQVASPEWQGTGGPKFAVALLDDTLELLGLGRPGLVVALTDLYRLLEASGESMADKNPHLKNRQSVKDRKQAKKTMRSAVRKVFFLSVWVHEEMQDNEGDIVPSPFMNNIAQLQAAKEELSKTMEEGKSCKINHFGKSKPGSVRLVEVLPDKENAVTE
eukprot:TRINITY_DN6820_c0_g2_i1.p1 TRINITY_DN6820_c0_g2~~TRINITY_DN6820_c0_g2_i1.p1  ORF type:complete len:197 (-),score=49.63 TRINITY_DN6820_c0_g2_i1:49-639(-)